MHFPLSSGCLWCLREAWPEGPGKDTVSALEYHTTFHQLAHDATH